jgi:hypothetical protein
MTHYDLARTIHDFCRDSGDASALTALADDGRKIECRPDRGLCVIKAPMATGGESEFDLALLLLQATWSRRFTDGVVGFLDENGQAAQGVVLERATATISVIEEALDSLLAPLLSQQPPEKSTDFQPQFGPDMWSIRI